MCGCAIRHKIQEEEEEKELKEEFDVTRQIEWKEELQDSFGVRLGIVPILFRIIV